MKNKLILWTGITLAVLPEILWSPLAAVSYGIINSDLRRNFRENWLLVDHLNILALVIFFQIGGLVLVLFHIYKLGLTGFVKKTIFTFMSLIAVIVLFEFLFVLAFRPNIF